jgi:aryl-alcohol dehydrogenase-like predicted oxidoreductase
MQYGNVPTLSKPVSRLVQGCIMFTEEEAESGLALLDGVFGLGCTTFDTAHVYAGGQSERVLGQWMDARGNRDQVFILSKGAHHNADRRRVTPFDIASDLHDSLARLRTDYIDLYLLHRDDPSLPVGPIVESLNEHLALGRIHAFGGSNWSHERIEEANAYAEARGLVPFVASSPNYTLAEQSEPPWAGCVSLSGEQGAGARAWYGETSFPLFTWSTLAQGFLTGKLTRENLETEAENFPESCIRSYAHEKNFQRLDRLLELSEKKGVTIPQLALAWVHAQGLNVFTLVGCSTTKEYETNAEALDIELSEEEVKWLDLRD